MISFLVGTTAQTWIVSGILALLVITTLRKRTTDSFFSHHDTTELKGLAILMVVLSHIGYFLVTDHAFLVPLSNYAGVGVDLFLILSGYGLTSSLLRSAQTRGQFYRKRLIKIYLPVVATVAIITVVDRLFLHRSYPLLLTLQNLFGLFPHADLFNDLNSPLWFITLLLANYLLLPLIWIRRAPWLTALLLAGLVSIIMIPDYPGKIFPSFTLGWMYRLHMYAFPLGIALSWLLHPAPTATGLVNTIITRISAQSDRTKNFLRAAVCLVCSAAFILASTSSFVGSGVAKEIVLSLSVSIVIIAFWIAKPLQSTTLTYIGTYSFELYLLHWPLLSRYNPFFAHLPPGFATIMSLAILMVLSRLFHYGNERLQALFAPRP